MSVWRRISEAISALAAGEGLSSVFERLRTPPERTVGFTIAVIALGAKMAKADGHVSRGEVAAFREVFHIPPEAEAGAARVFDLARRDVAGFETYAARIASMFGQGHGALADVLDGLFHIAMADGRYHPAEDAFLERTAAAFGVSDRCFARLRAQHVPGAEADPWDVLGVDPGAGRTAARQAWRALVRETHPDRMAARGVPKEAVALAEKRLVAVNRAWDAIRERAA